MWGELSRVARFTILDECNDGDTVVVQDVLFVLTRLVSKDVLTVLPRFS